MRRSQIRLTPVALRTIETFFLSQKLILLLDLHEANPPRARSEPRRRIAPLADDRNLVMDWAHSDILPRRQNGARLGKLAVLLLQQKRVSDDSGEEGDEHANNEEPPTPPPLALLGTDRADID